MCKSAVRQARSEGLRLGLIRPISVWPYPEKAFAHAPEGLKGYVSVEMSLSAQMGQDILLATRFRKPVYACLTTLNLPTAEGIIDYCRGIIAGAHQPMEVL